MADFVPPDNDRLSRAFEDIVPEKYKGTDKFLDVVSWNIRWFNSGNSDRVALVTNILNALNADMVGCQKSLVRMLCL